MTAQEKTPQQKAKELVNKYLPHVRFKMGADPEVERAKACALIAVEEIMRVNQLWAKKLLDVTGEDLPFQDVYYKQVKAEIENL